MLVGLHCKCGKKLKVPETRVGKSGTCPNCRAGLRLVAPGFRTGVDEFDSRFEIIDGPDRIGEIIFLAGPGPIEIGRHPQKHIVFAGETISRTHCRLVRDDNAWRIEDNKSASGLRLNGRKTNNAGLHDGDKIRIGDYELRYLSEVPETSPLSAFDAPPVFAEDTTDVPSPDETVRIENAPTDPAAEDDAAADDGPVEPAPIAASLDADNLYKLSDGDALEVAREHEPTSVTALAAQRTSGGPVCPSCNKSLAPGAKICVTCGIDVQTGRAILTSHAADVVAIRERTYRIIWWISWLDWFGFSPVASEGFGVRKPHFIRAVAVLTVLTSFWFWCYDFTNSPKMIFVKNYMLWVGNGKPDPAITLLGYEYSTYGDSAGFKENLRQLRREREIEKAKASVNGDEAKVPPAKVTPKADKAQVDSKDEATEDTTDTEVTEEQAESEDAEETADSEDEEDLDPEDEDNAALILAAHEALPRDKQFYGHYSPGQLITHAFLHGGIFHLAGNLLLLLVIGSRVNALVGNLPMLILYPVLAMASAIIFMASKQSCSPSCMLGASGAIMGLSGMYLILMPVHKMYVAFWFRYPPLWLKVVPIRGFWMVLVGIAWDFLYTAIGVDDGVAHWAHLGGFFAGIGIALLLLFTRLVNCRGGDIVSAMLGKHAWAFIGKPDLDRKAPLEYGW